jgi:hypothetical protein
MRSWWHVLAWALLVAVLVPGSLVADGPVAAPPPVPRAPLVWAFPVALPQYSWPAARRALLRLPENGRPIGLAVYERFIDERIDLYVRIAMGMSLFR